MIASALSEVVGLATLLVALAAIGVSVYLWQRGRQRKAIAYELTSSRVVSVRQEAEDRIQVLLDGVAAHDVRLVDLRIVCTGNTPITAGDFERPFSVDLGSSARVLTPEVVRTEPERLSPVFEVQVGRLVIEPLLLNPGDSFAAVALVSEMAEKIELDGRIAGVSQFSNLAGVGAARQRRVEQLYTIASFVTGVIFGISMFLAIVFLSMRLDG
jgi:hypothetical protein